MAEELGHEENEVSVSGLKFPLETPSKQAKQWAQGQVLTYMAMSYFLRYFGGSQVVSTKKVNSGGNILKASGPKNLFEAKHEHISSFTR